MRVRHYSLRTEQSYGSWLARFSARSLSVDPRSGEVRRHHLHESGLQRVAKKEAGKAGLVKNVGCHTMRHFFATHLLEGGYDIRTVQELMPKTGPFEQYAELYDAWFDRHREMYAAELQAIGRFIKPGKGEGLEVGIGSGKFAVPLGIKTGLDPATAMLKKAAAAGIKVFRGVAELLPFADQSFDFALMVTTICFVDDLVQSFKEVFRVLRPGGFIIVAFVDKNSTLGRQYLERKEKSKFYRQEEFFSFPEVLAALQTAGFLNFEVVQTLFGLEATGEIENGYGKGAFVVIKGMK